MNSYDWVNLVFALLALAVFFGIGWFLANPKEQLNNVSDPTKDQAP